jgi:hypothetical protein
LSEAIAVGFIYLFFAARPTANRERQKSSGLRDAAR